MPQIHFYPPPQALAFMVRQFESIRLPENPSFTDKFIPRPDAAIVFHFKASPQIIGPVAITLPPFFHDPAFFLQLKI